MDFACSAAAFSHASRCEVSQALPVSRSCTCTCSAAMDCSRSAAIFSHASRCDASQALPVSRSCTCTCSAAMDCSRSAAVFSHASRCDVSHSLPSSRYVSRSDTQRIKSSKRILKVPSSASVFTSSFIVKDMQKSG